ncbi:MAG: type VI secretion system tip protein VgrG [Pseudomonadota bacterium]
MDGVALAREHQLLAVNVTKSANRISSARIVYLDGAAASGDFPLSNSDSFVPGREVEILAGTTGDPVTLFKGIAIRQSLKVRDHCAPQLVVECRHKAVKLTVGPKNAYFLDQKDSEIIDSLLQNAGLEAEVENTVVTHKQQVQYSCSDWDFLLMRAEANGKLVFTADDRVIVKSPATGGPAVCSLRFGATILEMDAQIDARQQYSSVKSATWDATQQELVEKEAADPGINGPGNLGSDELAAVAGLDHYHLQHAALAGDEAQAWADARWLKSQFSRVNGRVKCEGIATANPGDTVTLGGIGERYNGDVFVSGVRHDFDLVQGWKTNLQFGNLDSWLGEEQAVSAPKASALLPGICGLQIGIVTGNEDPDGEHRVRVKMPLVDQQGDGTWARVATIDAGEQRGFFFRPEIGDEVVLGFLNDDPRQAVLIGMLHSSAKGAPLQGSDDNHEKIYQSRSRMKLYFNDDTKVMRLETPAGNMITLSEEDQAVKIIDQNGNKLEMTPDGITIESDKAITLKAGTELKLESGTALNVKGGTELKLSGTSGAEVSSSGVTKVKGSLLQLN